VRDREKIREIADLERQRDADKRKKRERKEEKEKVEEKGKRKRKRSNPSVIFAPKDIIKKERRKDV
jgi:hypothetical protein